jgi:hypothetical protein
MLHNIFLESRRVHIRTLCDFFSNTKNVKHPDDLIYKDFLMVNTDLSVKMDDKLRAFINKSTAHLTKKRGQFSLKDDDILQVSKDLIKAINRFMREIENGNLCDDYKEKLLDKDGFLIFSQRKRSTKFAERLSNSTVRSDAMGLLTCINSCLHILWFKKARRSICQKT